MVVAQAAIQARHGSCADPEAYRLKGSEEENGAEKSSHDRQRSRPVISISFSSFGFQGLFTIRVIPLFGNKHAMIY